MVTSLPVGDIPSMASVPGQGRATVLVFDSGVGGLSVYSEIHQLLPDLRYLYVFDNAAFPYGELDDAFIVPRVMNIIGAVARRYPLTLAVIACNTASTITLPALRSVFDFPVVGVVPAIKPAASLTRNGVVGLLATRATVRRAYTQDLVARFAHACRTEMLGSSVLVKLAEDKLHGCTVSIGAIRDVVKPWLTLPVPPDTVVLGCTHFPFLSGELRQVLPEGTHLIDSGAAVARRTAWLLEHEFLAIYPDENNENNVAMSTAFTDEVRQLLPVLRHYGFKTFSVLPLEGDFE